MNIFHSELLTARGLSVRSLEPFFPWIIAQVFNNQVSNLTQNSDFEHFLSSEIDDHW
jgi:hypothetical protein